MRLYQDYKSEQELQKREAKDREQLGITQDTVIIYQPSRAELLLRNVVKILLLFLMIAVIVGGVVALAFFCK